jgi:hypothetical protein
MEWRPGNSGVAGKDLAMLLRWLSSGAAGCWLSVDGGKGREGSGRARESRCRISSRAAEQLVRWPGERGRQVPGESGAIPWR